MRVALTGLLATLLLAHAASATAAEPRGRLDRSFGERGRLVAQLPPAYVYSEIKDVVAGPGGKPVTVTARRDGLIQYRESDGRLDRELGGSDREERTNVLALATDRGGGLLYGIESPDGCDEITAVMRLGVSGEPDEDFGSPACGGEIPFIAEVVTRGEEGGVLVAGRLASPPDVHIDFGMAGYVARLTAEGELDGSFGDGGVVDLGLDRLPDELVSLPGGFSAVAVGDELLRLGPDGKPDEDFGDDGAVDVPGSVRGMLASGEKLLVLYRDEDGTRVRRYLRDGSPDRGFGDDGTAGPLLVGSEGATKMAPGPDGGVMVPGPPSEGSCANGPCRVAAVLARLHPDGSLDSGYGREGMARLELSPRSGTVDDPSLWALATTASGRAYLVVGARAPKGDRYPGYLLSATPDGEIDTSFGEDGLVSETKEVRSIVYPRSVTVGAGGRLFVGADSNSGYPVERYIFPPERLLLRFRLDGASAAPRSLGPEIKGYRVIASPSGSPVFVEGQRSLIRIGRNGRPDPRYGRGGEVRIPKRMVARFLPQRDGSVLAVGSLAGRMAAVWFDRRGRLRREFGRNGFAIVGFPLGASATASTALVRPDGHLLLGGKAGGRPAMASLSPDGRWDRGFGVAARLARGLGGRGAHIVDLVRRGRHGVVAEVGRARTALVALGPRGRRDRRFGRRGVVHPRRAGEPIGLLSYPRRIVAVTRPDGEGFGIALHGFRPSGAVARRFGRRGHVLARTRQEKPFIAIDATRSPAGRIFVVGATAAGFPKAGTEILAFR